MEGWGWRVGVGGPAAVPRVLVFVLRLGRVKHGEGRLTKPRRGWDDN